MAFIDAHTVVQGNIADLTQGCLPIPQDTNRLLCLLKASDKQDCSDNDKPEVKKYEEKAVRQSKGGSNGDGDHRKDEQFNQ
jgi:hypothetical protein